MNDQPTPDDGANSRIRLRHAIIGIVYREPRFLAIQRSATISAPGKICFPGGGMEEGESEPEALQREWQEELAVEVLPVAKLAETVSHWGYRLSWWQAELPDGYQLVPNPEEVADVFWATAEELLGMDLLDSNADFLARWQSGSVKLVERP